MLDLWVSIIALGLAFLAAVLVAGVLPTLERIADALEAIAHGERGGK